MQKRKQFLVYKEFQKKLAFSMIIILIISNLIIGVGMLSVMFYNNERILHLNKKQKEMALQLQAKTTTSDKLTIDGKLQNLIILNSTNAFVLGRITKHNKLLVIAIASFILFYSCIIYILMIRKTHKIAGPIFLISNYIKDITNGTLPDTRPLRKNDELTDFYDLFVEMVDTLKKRNG